jgi:PPM family protein phosphatase
MKSSGIGYTDKGNVRELNEDTFLVDDGLGLYVVSDGMGGHAAGDVASREAVSVAADYIRTHSILLEQIRSGLTNESLLTSLAVAAVAKACREVYRKATRDPDLTGMGCTMTLLLLGRHKAAMAHVGDSRLYLHRCERVRQLSSDHNLAQELVRLGVITSLDAQFVPEGSSLTRAIGIRESVAIDELLITLEPGDRFLLCSDGLWDYLDDPCELEPFLTQRDAEVSAQSLIEFARTSGGHDNITAVVIEVTGERQDAEDAACVPAACAPGMSTTLKLPQPSSPDLPS